MANNKEQELVIPGGGGGSVSGDPINYRAENYTGIVALATNPQLNELAYARNSEGTRWLPWSLGGTYYPSGLYWYDGTSWVSDREAIAEQLEINVEDIDQLETDLALKMSKSVYDPNNVQDDVFDYANFLGVFQVKGQHTTVNLDSDKDNLDVDGYNIVYLTSGSQDRRITGVKKPAAGVNRMIIWISQSSNRIKFVGASGNSLAGNRLALRSNAGTRNLLQNQITITFYSHKNDVWYVFRMG